MSATLSTKPYKLRVPADPTRWAIATLEEVYEYLERFADVKDGDYGAPEPNEAMQLMGDVEDAIEFLSGVTLPTSSASQSGEAVPALLATDEQSTPQQRATERPEG